jgi:hypothetical protein
MLKDADEVEAIKELNTISDRAAAIVGAAILEARIESALKILLFDHEKRQRSLSMTICSEPLAHLEASAQKSI